MKEDERRPVTAQTEMLINIKLRKFQNSDLLDTNDHCTTEKTTMFYLF